MSAGDNAILAVCRTIVALVRCASVADLSMTSSCLVSTFSYSSSLTIVPSSSNSNIALHILAIRFAFQIVFSCFIIPATFILLQARHIKCSHWRQSQYVRTWRRGTCPRAQTKYTRANQFAFLSWLFRSLVQCSNVVNPPTIPQSD